MTEHTETKEFDPNDPRNQASVQIGDPDAEPGSPGYYSPPNPNAGITRSASNEVLTPEMIEKAEEIPDTRSDFDKGKDKTGHKAGRKGAHAKTKLTDEEYEAHTIPELREIADERGIEIKSDARKDEIIEALKQG